VIAPIGRDGELIATVLQQNGIPVELATAEAVSRLQANHEPMGPLLLAEEALSPALIHQLARAIQGQPAWSDWPILILTAGGRETAHSRRLEHDWKPLGSPVLLERPIRTATLVSSVTAALRARARQYEIRDALASLREERETLETMLDHLPVGVVLAKPSGEIVRGNRRLEEILRHPVLPTPDIEAHGNWVAFHEDGTRVRGEEFPLPRAMQEGIAPPPEDYLYERGDGTKAWISLAAAPILDEQGTVIGGVATVADIDQQKRAEAALIQSEKLAVVGRLAASISHEINNPLEAVTNLLFLAQQEPALSEEAKSYLQTADQELRRVSQIVGQTLRFHRQSTHSRVISARELLEPTLALYAGRIANARIRLEVQYRGVDLVKCFEGEIRQVLNNLIGNAVDAMNSGGVLTVRTSDTHMWGTGVPAVRLTVADNGSGMPAEVMSRIFEPFYTTKGQNGTGLGLWISRGIVEKHHGCLQVCSSTRTGRKGTIFSLLLPKNLN
jgi:signal transduction histidine kinase